MLKIIIIYITIIFIYKIIIKTIFKIKVVCQLSTSKSKILHHSTKNYISSFIHIGTNIQHATAKSLKFRV